MLLLIIVQHVSQNVLCVLQSLCHLGIVAIQCLVEWHGGPLALLVDVGDVAVLGVEQDFSVILEVNLNYLVAEAEHDCMFGTHPFFDVNGAGRVLQFIGLVQFISLNELLFFLGIVVLLQVGLEVLQ